ncbi:rRNA maturation RNase YbeY [Sulfurimonas sp. HSL-3221]|uniref:rRNA maturation RNase YbeY n=1 Tax=Sulfurimonadaceae TaxID=2771471 RepID=UPI001E4C5F37|nr:rRNA maturation RNase YbeY [Sulfurimonas sp. HSL-3221]UFS61325.1 rRNA maturation RNase YbeY [Sulfurimonas sp. HSL-3221]
MIDIDNQTDFLPDFTLLDAIVDALDAGEMELVICDDETIRVLNRDHRGIDKATDVLSFPYDPMPMAPIGSIVISADHVRSGAARFGHSETEECALLFLHGVLHLLGFDHETDEGEMRRKEEEVIKALGLPSSLIVRTEEA